jgi:competence protein ComEA
MLKLLSTIALFTSLLVPTLVPSLATARDAAEKAPVTDKAKPVDAKPAVNPKPAPAPSEKVKIVDINSASEADLVALPGVGEAYAKKIVAGRPYAKKDQLKSRKILPDGVYAKVQKLIVAEKPAAADTAQDIKPK